MTPTAGVGIDQQLRPFAYEALHHGRCIVRAMLRHQGLHLSLIHIFNALREWFGGSARGAANAAGPPLAAVKPTLRVSGAALTDTGPVRPANEDCVRCLLEDGGELGARVSLLIVADGMGGHQAGEVASQTVVDALSEDWHRRPRADVGQLLEHAIRRAGAQVYACLLYTSRCV